MGEAENSKGERERRREGERARGRKGGRMGREEGERKKNRISWCETTAVGLE